MTGWMILSCVLFIILCVSVYFNFKHGMIILAFQDKIEESLDILDEKYSSISAILETPVFFDSMEIRQVIKDITASRDSILYIANNLCAIEGDVEIEEGPDLESPNKIIDG